MKYRKKPVVVEAIQYKEDNLQEIINFVGPSLRVDGSCSTAETGIKIRHDVYIHTLEVTWMLINLILSSKEFMENSIYASQTSLKRHMNLLQTKTKK